jgi:hypothetical protein
MNTVRPTWLRIAAGTAKPRFSAAEIQRHFREADRAGRLTVPDIETCGKVAARIEELLSLSEEPLSAPVSSETRKHARLFILHLRKDRDALRNLGASEVSLSGWNTLVDDAETALAPFLASSAAGDKLAPLAASLAHLARAAWRSSGREPRDIGPDSAIVCFVAAVLGTEDQDSISRGLRKARRKARLD